MRVKERGRARQSHWAQAGRDRRGALRRQCLEPPIGTGHARGRPRPESCPDISSRRPLIPIPIPSIYCPMRFYRAVGLGEERPSRVAGSLGTRRSPTLTSRWKSLDAAIWYCVA